MPRVPSHFVSLLIRFLRTHRAGTAISGTVCTLSLFTYTVLYLIPRPSPFLALLADVELKTLDIRSLLRGQRKPSPSVFIVAIDQKSQDVLGKWPFPRSYFADLVNFLRGAHARLVAFDINFPQPDQNSALEALRQVRQEYNAHPAIQSERFDSQLRVLEMQADNDRKFAESLSHFDNAILGYFFLAEKEVGSQNPERVKEFLNYLSFQAYPQIVHPEYSKLFEGWEALGLSPNLPAFAQYAKNFGYFNVLPDADGTVRREPVVIRFQDNLYPSLDIAAALAYTNRPLDQVAVVFNPNGLERIDLGPVRIPTDNEGYVQIDYYGP